MYKEITKLTLVKKSNDETIKSLNKTVSNFNPFNLLLWKVNKLFIRKFELAALIIANGRAYEHHSNLRTIKRDITK